MKWVLLLLGTYLFCYYNYASSLKCFDCQGINCQKGFCYGTYCVMSTFQPDNGKPILLKGCISGSMLKPHIQDQCETFEDTVETAVGEKHGKLKTCFCGSNFCNGNLEISKVVRDDIKLLNCHCDHCGSLRHCQGEFCSINTNKLTGYSSRGCMNTTAAPIVSRGAINSCSRPGITDSLKIFNTFHHSDFLGVESCLCNEFQFCNFKLPLDLNKERMECPLNLKVERNGKTLELGGITKCRGEFCLEMKLNNTGSAAHDISFMDLNGCATRRSLYLVEEFHAIGCLEIVTGGMQISVCYKNPSEMKESKTKTKTTKESSGLNTMIVLLFLFLIIMILVAGGVLRLNLINRFRSVRYQSVS